MHDLDYSFIKVDEVEVGRIYNNSAYRPVIPFQEEEEEVFGFKETPAEHPADLIKLSI